MSAQDYESYTGAAKFVATQIGKLIGGNIGQAYVGFLTGQASWLASVADLTEKMSKGQAKGEDFADVASQTASLLASFGVLTGTAAPWTLLATGALGGALFAWKHRIEIKDSISQGIERIKELTTDGGIQGDPFTGMPWPGVDPTVNTATTEALNWRPPPPAGGGCPIILDLDGGGISNSGIAPGYPILFDHDAAGLRNATGWVGAGGAILVRDLNGNGTIDSWRELFGDNTILTNKQKVAHGFAALDEFNCSS